MFEYLMPSLVMRAPAGSLLEQTSRLIVERQIGYGAELGVPWGISESAYNARDLELTYQYSNFGVPGLGLKRGLAREHRHRALRHRTCRHGRSAERDAQFRATQHHRCARRDMAFMKRSTTRARVCRTALSVAIVRAYMAHHQGMTIVAIANVLLDGEMRARFHAEPSIQATELLLQERAPRDVSIVRPRAQESSRRQRRSRIRLPEVRRLHSAHDATPQTHLLSNGRYSVMLTAPVPATAAGGIWR